MMLLLQLTNDKLLTGLAGFGHRDWSMIGIFQGKHGDLVEK